MTVITIALVVVMRIVALLVQAMVVMVDVMGGAIKRVLSPVEGVVEIVNRSVVRIVYLSVMDVLVPVIYMQAV